MSYNFTSGDIDHFLYIIAKEYKKQNRQNPEFELILVGGSSIILNYHFRGTTTDIDSIIRASSNIKEIINKIGDENGFETGWLNDDFTKTASFSKKLIEHSIFYKRFYNCLNVRTVNDEYLLAMKLCSYREYKNDISDIIGIIKENIERGNNITYTTVNTAYKELYGNNAEIPEKASRKLKEIFSSENYEELYYSTIDEEKRNKAILLKAEEKYGNMVNQNTISKFLNM